MKLLSYCRDKDSNEFEPQVLVAELESENLRVIKLVEKNWYGFGLYQPKDEIICDLEKLKDIPKVICLRALLHKPISKGLFHNIILK